MFGLFSSNTAYKALKFDYQVLQERLEDSQHEAYSWKRAAEAAKADCDNWILFWRFNGTRTCSNGGACKRCS